MLFKMTRGLLLITLAFILILPCSISAETINGDAALVSELLKAAAGDSETLKQIKKDLNDVKHEYTKGTDTQIALGDPAAFSQMGSRFFVISFDASIISPTPKTAMFSLLYEKQDSGELEYTENYLSWVGATEVEGFTSLTTVSLCALFENLTGRSICESERAKQVFDSEMEELNARIQEQLSQTAAKKHTHSAGDITEGKLKASLIDDAICRDAELTTAISSLKQEIEKRPLPDADAKSGSTDGVTDIEALKAQINELKQTVAHLSALLEGVSRDGSSFIFSGMNVHVVSGSGATDGTPNGLGNLIVGYNENGSQNTTKTNIGSHNLVIGKNQTYSSYGGFVAGASNKITAPFATITGGFNNTASGSYSSVGGGQLNTASGDFATVSGGLTRKAEGNNNWSAGDQTAAK